MCVQQPEINIWAKNITKQHELKLSCNVSMKLSWVTWLQSDKKSKLCFLVIGKNNSQMSFLIDWVWLIDTELFFFQLSVSLLALLSTWLLDWFKISTFSTGELYDILSYPCQRMLKFLIIFPSESSEYNTRFTSYKEKLLFSKRSFLY